jgi:hypothetical protein
MKSTLRGVFFTSYVDIVGCPDHSTSSVLLPDLFISLSSLIVVIKDLIGSVVNIVGCPEGVFNFHPKTLRPVPSNI